MPRHRCAAAALTAGKSALSAAAMLSSSGQQAITPQMVQRFARTARERIRIDGGGYRRDHLRALARRVEVADDEIRIMGSKGNLLRTLAAASGAKPATSGVRSSVLKWRRGRDSNPRYPKRVQRFSRPPRSTAPAPLLRPGDWTGAYNPGHQPPQTEPLKPVLPRPQIRKCRGIARPQERIGRMLIRHDRRNRRSSRTPQPSNLCGACLQGRIVRIH